MIYIISMVFLFLHLGHGAQSFVQTFGLNNGKSLPVVGLVGKGFSIVLLLGYASIPVFILVGFVK